MDVLIMNRHEVAHPTIADFKVPLQQEKSHRCADMFRMTERADGVAHRIRAVRDVVDNHECGFRYVPRVPTGICIGGAKKTAAPIRSRCLVSKFNSQPALALTCTAGPQPPPEIRCLRGHSEEFPQLLEFCLASDEVDFVAQHSLSPLQRGGYRDKPRRPGCAYRNALDVDIAVGDSANLDEGGHSAPGCPP